MSIRARLLKLEAIPRGTLAPGQTPEERQAELMEKAHAAVVNVAGVWVARDLGNPWGVRVADIFNRYGGGDDE